MLPSVCACACVCASAITSCFACSNVTCCHPCYQLSVTCTDVDDVRLPMTLATKSSHLDLSSSRNQLKARVRSGYTCIEMKDAVPAETLSQAAAVIDCHRLSSHYNSTAATTVITTGTCSIVTTTALHYSNSCQHYRDSTTPVTTNTTNTVETPEKVLPNTTRAAMTMTAAMTRLMSSTG